MDVGQGQAFTASASGGTSPYTYKWYLGGGAVGTDSASYTFDALSVGSFSLYVNVTDSASVPVTVESNTASITVKSAPTVNIGPVGPVTLDAGQAQTFTASASGGTGTLTYQWYLNGSPVGSDSSTYVFSGSAGSYSVTCKVTDSASVPASAASNAVSITVNQLTITVTQGANGVIAPGTTTVNYGGSQTFAVTPNTGYYIASITVDGSPVAVTSSSGQTVSFTDVQANHTLTATYTLLDSCLVVRGEDDQIYYNVYNSTTASWSGWNSLPSGATIDSPAATLVSNTLYIVVRGMDGASLWFSSVNLTDNSFSGWTLLSGSTPSAPTLTSNGTALALVVQGNDNNIYYQFYTIATQTWSGWTALPSGTTIDSPAASLVGNTLYIVVRGSDGATLWFSNINSTTDVFSGWTQLSGATPSAPTLTSNGTALALVVQGEDNNIYSCFYTIATQTWTGWTALPSGTTPDSPAATILQNTLYITVVGSDGNGDIYQSSINLDTSTFSGWTLLSGSTPSKPTLAG